MPDRPLIERPKAELLVEAEVRGVDFRDVLPGLAPPAEPVADPQDPEAEPVLPPFIPEPGQVEKPVVVRKLVEDYTDDELKALPEVATRDRIRDHRHDWEAAARGEMIEVEREEAARAWTEAANAAIEGGA